MFSIDKLMILCYILSRDCRSCRIFLPFDRGVMELLPHNKQASRKLLPVGSIVANGKSLFTLGNNKIGDIHHALLREVGLLRSSTMILYLSALRFVLRLRSEIYPIRPKSILQYFHLVSMAIYGYIRSWPVKEVLVQKL